GSARRCLGLVEFLNRFLEVVAPDETHGVERPAILMLAQAVDGHDPGMLQPTGDLRLEHDPATPLLILAQLPADFLEGALAVQLGILGHKPPAQSPAGVLP